MIKISNQIISLYLFVLIVYTSSVHNDFKYTIYVKYAYVSLTSLLIPSPLNSSRNNNNIKIIVSAVISIVLVIIAAFFISDFDFTLTFILTNIFWWIPSSTSNMTNNEDLDKAPKDMDFSGLEYIQIDEMLPEYIQYIQIDEMLPKYTQSELSK